MISDGISRAIASAAAVLPDAVGPMMATASGFMARLRCARAEQRTEAKMQAPSAQAVSASGIQGAVEGRADHGADAERRQHHERAHQAGGGAGLLRERRHGAGLRRPGS